MFALYYEIYFMIHYVTQFFIILTALKITHCNAFGDPPPPNPRIIICCIQFVIEQIKRFLFKTVYQM